MKLLNIDYFNPCPDCGGALTYDWTETDEDDGRSSTGYHYRYACNVCQVQGAWRATREGAVASMAAQRKEKAA